MCEVPLRVTRCQERTLEVRFEAGHQLYNAFLGEATKKLALVRQSIWYTKAKKSTDKKARQAHFGAARQAHGFSAYALEAFADEMRRTTWLGEHLDSHVVQKLADRAFAAVQKVAFGQAKKSGSKASADCTVSKGRRMLIAQHPGRGETGIRGFDAMVRAIAGRHTQTEEKRIDPCECSPLELLAGITLVITNSPMTQASMQGVQSFTFTLHPLAGRPGVMEWS